MIAKTLAPENQSAGQQNEPAEVTGQLAEKTRSVGTGQAGAAAGGVAAAQRWVGRAR
jgi:hypothetical protein